MRTRLTKFCMGIFAGLSLAVLSAPASHAQLPIGFRPIGLVSGTVPLPNSADPTTGWTIHNRANIGLTAIKSSTGLTVVKIIYSDTQGITFSGATSRGALLIKPLYLGSSTPSEFKITMTALVKYYTDQVTLDLKYAGRDVAGNPVYNVTCEAWDITHTYNWVKADGQFVSAISDVHIATQL
jgi:hypothetical protein